MSQSDRHSEPDPPGGREPAPAGKEGSGAGPASRAVEFIASRLLIRESSLWRVMGLLKPMRGRIIAANIILALASSVAAMGLVSLRPLFSSTLGHEAAEAMSRGELHGPMNPEEKSGMGAGALPASSNAPAAGPAITDAAGRAPAGEHPARETAARRALRRLPGPLAGVAGPLVVKWEELNAWAKKDVGRFVLIYSCFILFLYLVVGALEFCGEMIMSRVAVDVMGKLLRDVYANVLRQEMHFFNNTTSATLLNTCYREVFQIRSMIILLASTRVMLPVNMLILAVALFAISFELTLLLAALLPIVIVPTMLLTRAIKRGLAREVDEETGAMDIMSEGFHGIKAIKAFGAENLEMKILDPWLESYKAETNRRRAAQIVVEPAVDVLNMLVLLLVFVIAAFVFPDNMRFEQGKLMVFLFAITRFYKPFRSLMTMNVAMQRANAAARRIFTYLDRKPEIADAPDAVDFPRDWDAIRFKDVHLAYRIKRPGRKAHWRPALQGADFEIRRGEAVALAGPNGAGKSSIVNLLCRLYDPTAGEILAGSTPLRSIRLASLRENICLITQHPVLFNRSVADNIAFGREGVTPDEIVEAAKATGGHGFISRLPQGYDTPVGEGGRLLSGGEQQKIVLARAFVRHPRVLILDEPTTGLDHATTLDFLAIIDRLKTTGLTIVFITHDKSHLEHFNRVLRLTEDRRVEEIPEENGNPG